MKNFPCPSCGVDRESNEAHCLECGWQRKPQEKPDSRSICFICRKYDFEWGYLQGHYKIVFKGDESTDVIGKITVFGGEEVRARKCLSCGNIQLFSNE